MRSENPFSLSQLIKAAIATIATFSIGLLGTYYLFKGMADMNSIYLAQSGVTLAVASMGLNSLAKFWREFFNRNN